MDLDWAAILEAAREYLDSEYIELFKFWVVGGYIAVYLLALATPKSKDLAGGTLVSQCYSSAAVAFLAHFLFGVALLCYWIWDYSLFPGWIVYAAPAFVFLGVDLIFYSVLKAKSAATRSHVVGFSQSRHTTEAGS